MNVVIAQEARCCAITEQGRYCRREPTGDVPEWLGLPDFIDLCSQHLMRAIGQHQVRANKEARALYAARQQVARDAAVYYVQRGDGLIKIGFTTNWQQRFPSLKREHGPLDLLATHKGGRRAEGVQHERFKEHRVVGEWFYPAPELLDHIARISARRAEIVEVAS